MYNRIKEGIAISIKITAGIKVQILSITWASMILIDTLLFNKEPIIEIPTNVRIIARITIIKSWKNTNSSITGELAS